MNSKKVIDTKCNIEIRPGKDGSNLIIIDGDFTVRYNNDINTEIVGKRISYRT